MDAFSAYAQWLAYPNLDDETRDELLAIAGQKDEIEARFFDTLAFGTAGLRGIMGAGLYRMNNIVVRYTTQGLARMILQSGKASGGVAIAYDSRIHAQDFARETACVLAANGIPCYLFDDIRPTPELSFVVRQRGCVAGVNVTASHNPKEYNGYKVFWEGGIQLSPEQAGEMAQLLKGIDLFADVKVMPYEQAVAQGLITAIGPEEDEAFMAAVLEQSIHTQSLETYADKLKLVYTPFHGSGYRLVPEVLRRMGVANVCTVPEQMIPDGNFPTVVSPNPQDKEGFVMAMALADREGIDLIIGTDPDADRVGMVARKKDGSLYVFSGNQIGALLLDYCIRARKETGTMPENPAAVTSIVSTRISRAICRKHGVALFETLTGFKFIGTKIEEFTQAGTHNFVFAFEESHGYSAGLYARDKDAVVASMLIAEMACYYLAKNMTLHDALLALYEEYGHHCEADAEVVMPGMEGVLRMRKVCAELRESPPGCIGGCRVMAMTDYLNGTVLDMETGKQTTAELPSSDVLAFEFVDGSTLMVRPSGTEPKVKLYALTRGADWHSAQTMAATLARAGAERIEG